LSCENKVYLEIVKLAWALKDYRTNSCYYCKSILLSVVVFD